MTRDSLTLDCPAKINLALSVGTSDQASGMHPICSWMVTLDFGDTLTLSRSSGTDSSYEILIASDAPTAQRIDWPIEKDLAFRAHGLMQQHVGRDMPINMELAKRIPSGAGLGGGSSDAAGVLVGLNQLFSLGLSDAQLMQLGMRLGSDVGFMVAAQLGKSSAIVSGFGERVDPIALHDALRLVLVLPDMHCATAEVYRHFDCVKSDARIDAQRVRRLASMRPLTAEAPFNDLTDAAFAVELGLAVLQGKVEQASGRPVHLSGSGAAMFVLAASQREAVRLADAISCKCGVPAIAVTTRA